MTGTTGYAPPKFDDKERSVSYSVRQQLKQLYTVVLGATISFLPATYLFSARLPLSDTRLTRVVSTIWFFSLIVLLHEWWRNVHYYWQHEVIFPPKSPVKNLYRTFNTAYVALLVVLALAVALGVRQTSAHQLTCLPNGTDVGIPMSRSSVCQPGDVVSVGNGEVYSLIPIAIVLGFMQLVDLATTACHFSNRCVSFE